MDLDSTVDSLKVAIKNLSPQQKMALASNYSQAYISNYFQSIVETIAIEAKVRVQSKIALNFNRGYSTGSLLDSIYYIIRGNTIQIKSTKNYFAILNKGFDSFDMKQALMGKKVRMRLPGGKIIFRTVGDSSDSNLGPYGKTKSGALKKVYSSKNWIHPGYQGQHIYEQVEQEMQPWISEYVHERVWAILRTIPNIPFATTQSGYIYYNKRNKQGKFQ